MRLTIEPPAELAHVNGAPCRVWSGFDEAGTEVLVWLAAVQPQTHDQERLVAFDRELRELAAPPSAAVFDDMRFVVD